MVIIFLCLASKIFLFVMKRPLPISDPRVCGQTVLQSEELCEKKVLVIDMVLEAEKGLDRHNYLSLILIVLVPFNWRRQRLFDQCVVFVLYELCMENAEAKVVDVKKKPVSR